MRGSDFSKEASGEQTAFPPSEQARLDEAMRRADDLLFHSLKSDDRRRAVRKRVLITLGGFAMIATVCYLLLIYAPAQVTPKTAPTAADSKESGQLAQQGWGLWQSGDLDAAAEKFEEALKLAPKNTNAMNGLGWARLNSGNYDAAEKAFKKLIAIEPKHPAALNGLGQLSLAQRKYKDAEKYLLKAAPQAPAAWYGLARVYLLTGKFDDAKKWAKKLVDSGDADESAQQMLEAAEAKELSPELRRQIEPGIAVAADDAPKPAGRKTASKGNEAMRGWQLFNQGRNAEAKELFEAALAANPKNGAALNGLGWCLLNSGETKEAKPYFERLLADDPNATGAMNGLARVLKSEGDLDGAIKVWEDAVEKSPGPTAMAYGLADAYLEKGEFRKAIPLLEVIAKAQPQDEQIKSKLAKAQARASE